MEQLRYTKFPDLWSPFNEEDPSDASYLWDADFNVPEEVLILSWASLLQSYTGSEEPVFAVATNDVKVDLLNQTISRVKAAPSVPGGCEWTGIFLQKVRAGPLQENVTNSWSRRHQIQGGLYSTFSMMLNWGIGRLKVPDMSRLCSSNRLPTSWSRLGPHD